MVDGLISKRDPFMKVKILILMYPRWIIMYCNHLSHKILIEKCKQLCIYFSDADSEQIQLITTMLKIVLFSEGFSGLWYFQTSGYICRFYTSEATASNKKTVSAGMQILKTEIEEPRVPFTL